MLGLSPRVRGNRSSGRGSTHKDARSIPACAGGTSDGESDSVIVRCGLSPRVRGNPGPSILPASRDLGLSPRVRGNQLTEQDSVTRWSGSIPACAGEPEAAKERNDRPGVYPRVCGGTIKDGTVHVGGNGLSPRVRGNPSHFNDTLDVPGSIPACAGEPCKQSRSAQSGTVYPRVCGGTTSSR